MGDETTEAPVVVAEIPPVVEPVGPGEPPLGPGEIRGYTPPQGDDKVPTDYFAFDETQQVMLPDGVSWVAIKGLTEGDRSKYLNAVNRDVKIARGSGEARIQTAPGDERRVLLEAAIVDWNLTQGGQPVPFTKGSHNSSLTRFLNKANPVVCDIIEKAIRMANPWLLSDMTVEQIEVEISNLEDMKKKILEEEEGKGFSSDR